MIHRLPRHRRLLTDDVRPARPDLRGRRMIDQLPRHRRFLPDDVRLRDLTSEDDE
jgi:hypothetical protein